MDGSFNQAAGRGQSAMSPQTPTSGSNYNTNMNRTKTRKWVEAKVQNYDGDDWGADEYDDEAEESDPEPPIPKFPTSQRLPSAVTTLPSQAGPAVSSPSASGPSGSSDLPSLRVQTQPPPPAMAAPANQPRQAAITSPVVSDPSSLGSPSDRVTSDQLVSPQSVGAGRDHDAPHNLTSQLASTEAVPEHTSGKALPFVRPSDIYRRMEEEKDKERQSQETGRPNMDTIVGSASDRSASPSKLSVEQPRRGSDKDDASENSFQSHSNLDTIPERQSEYGMEQLASKPLGPSASANPPPKTPTKQGEGETRDGSSEPQDPEGASASPKLPDVARMSAFGMDFFSPAAEAANGSAAPQEVHPALREEALRDHQMQDQTASASGPPNVTSRTFNEDSEHQDAGTVEVGPVDQTPQETTAADADTKHSTGLKRPDLPGGWVTETSSQDVASDQTGLAEEQARTTEQSVAPLRTPNSPGPVPDPQKESHDKLDSQPPGTDIAPTEPLQPRRLDSHSLDFEPRPIERETTFSTITSSPVKESDVLSDEIMRSLSPGGLAPGDKSGDDKQPVPGGRNAIRESSYTLRDYDSYWADTTDKSGPGDKAAPSMATEPVPPLPPIDVENTTAAQAGAPTNPENLTDDAPTSARPGGRRRFSWEAADDAANPTVRPTPADEHPGAIQSAGSSQPPIPAPSNGPSHESSGLIPSTARGQELTPISIPISHQVSEASTAHPVQEQSSLPEPPSPVSVASDKDDLAARQISRLSLSDEKTLTQEGSDLVSPSPPPEGHPALVASPSTAMAGRQASAPSSRVPVPAFRDIMGMSTPAERISKYNEARGALASTDSGLDSWMSSLRAQHAEHAGVASSHHVGGPQPPNQGGNAASPSGSRPPAQQPYYQQYLNASSPGGGTSPSGRSRLGGLPISTQAAGSAFGHSGNQIGTKGKEFMQSAGKMGKGLLSKGKSKLRGSGDKGESNPPPVQQNLKNERRTSWGLSLGARSRTDGPALHSSDNPDSANQPTPVPQLPQPARMSPFNPVSQGGSEQTSQWAAPQNGQNQYGHPVTGSSEGNRQPFTQTGFLAQTGEQRRGSHVMPPTKLMKSEGQSPSQQHDAVQGSSQWIEGLPTDDANNSVDDHSSDDWIVVPRTADGKIPGSAPPDSVVTASEKAPVRVFAEDSGIAMQSQAQPAADAVKRDPSFIGLPPIRRSSTFGLSPRARRATERFSLDDEDDVPAREVPLTEKGLGIQGPSSVSREAPVEALDGSSNSAYGGEEQAVPLPMVQQEPPRSSQLGENSRPGASVQDPRGATSGSPGIQPILPKSPPMLMNTMQRLPPSGPWKLEESHLSEPLHSVTRNRSDTGGSQQQILYGYDKETGMTSTPVPAQTQSNQARPRNSDLPPSSAQRYPELFSPRPEQDGRPRANSRTSAAYPHPQQYPEPISREDAFFPRTQSSEYEISGVGPPEDERGRKKRNSGLFKDIGNRIARATSRERRSSLAEPRPTSADIRGDEASESSVMTDEFRERKKRRSSLLFSFSGRPSMEQRPGDRPPSALAQSESRVDGMQSTTPPQSQAERKRSFFGVQHKFMGGGLARSSTSSLVNESRSGIDNSESGTTAQKKRFSDIATMFRPGQHQERKPQAPESMGPPEAPFQRVSRSGTGSSVDLAPPGALADSPGRRSRRGSVSGIFSGILGRKSESAAREQQPVEPGQASFEQQHPMHHANDNAPLGRPLSGHQSQVASAVSPQPDTTRAIPAQSDFHNPTTIKRVSQASAQQPRPSPLGIESPMTHGTSPTLNGPPELLQNPAVEPAPESDTVSNASSKRPLPGVATNIVKSPLSQPSDGAVHDVGVQRDMANEGEILRSTTVSPDLSVVSDGDLNERQLGFDQSAEHGVAAETADVPGQFETAAGGKSPVNDGQQPMPPLTHLQDARSSPRLGEPIGSRQAEPHMPLDASPRRIPDAPTALTDAQTDAEQRFIARSSPPLTVQQASFSGPRQRPGGDNRTGSDQPHGQQFPPVGGQPYLHQQGPYPVERRVTGPQPIERPSDVTQASMQAQRLVSGAHGYGNNGMGTSGEIPAKPSAPDGQTEGQGYRWKALRSRVTEQMAQITAQNHAKPEKGDKLTSGKILEVFKRGSRQAAPPSAQQSPSTQLAQQWQRSSLHARQPPFQEQTSYGHQAQQPSPGFNLNQPRRVSGAQETPMAAPPRQWQQGQPAGTLPDNMGQGLGLRQPEPQYDQVPIPQGYTAVHGDAMVVPSAYNIGRSVPQGQFYHPQQPYMGPAGYAQQQQQHQYQHPHQHHQYQHQHHQPAGAPFPYGMQQGQNHNFSAPGDRGAGHSPGHAIDAPRHGGVSATTSPASRPSGGNQAVRLDDETIRSGQVDNSPAPTEKGNRVAPPHGLDGNFSIQDSTKAVSDVAQPQEHTATTRSAVDDAAGSRDVSRPSSLSPQLTAEGNDGQVNGQKGNRRPSQLGLDVQKARGDIDDDIYAATPRVTKDETGESSAPSQISRMTSGEAEGGADPTAAAAAAAAAARSAKNEHRAELEDTEEIRVRTMRLEAQEEKILYHPDEDDDGPQMSATSYPGQEWNPYGEPEFGDWRDD